MCSQVCQIFGIFDRCPTIRAEWSTRQGFFACIGWRTCRSRSEDRSCFQLRSWIRHGVCDQASESLLLRAHMYRTVGECTAARASVRIHRKHDSGVLKRCYLKIQRDSPRDPVGPYNIDRREEVSAPTARGSAPTPSTPPTPSQLCTY